MIINIPIIVINPVNKFVNPNNKPSDIVSTSWINRDKISPLDYENFTWSLRFHYLGLTLILYNLEKMCRLENELMKKKIGKNIRFVKAIRSMDRKKVFRKLRERRKQRKKNRMVKEILGNMLLFEMLGLAAVLGMTIMILFVLYSSMQIQLYRFYF